MAGVLSKRIQFVLEKLKKRQPQRRGTEEEMLREATNLSDPAYIRDQFSYLLDSLSRLVDRTPTGDPREQGLTSLQARGRDAEDLATAMNLPVKLVLKRLNHARPPLANRLSQLLRCEYGPLHTMLQVGEVTIEWGNDGLVVPSFMPQLPGDLETEVPKETPYYRQTKQLTRALVAAEKKRDQVETFNVVFESMSEKTQLIDRLVDVIITYNCEKTYSIFRCNCQHFTRDALSALGYKDTIRFSSRMNDYFEQLKAGKLTVPEDYATHQSLDLYVREHLESLTLPDMEYLLCQYFKHHLPSMERLGEQDLDEWECEVEGCQSGELDLRVKDKSSFRAMHSWEELEADRDMLEELPDEVT